MGNLPRGKCANPRRPILLIQIQGPTPTLCAVLGHRPWNNAKIQMAKSARQSSLPSILPHIFLQAKMPPHDYFFFVSAPIFASSIQSQLNNGRFPPSSPPNGPMTPSCAAVLSSAHIIMRRQFGAFLRPFLATTTQPMGSNGRWRIAKTPLLPPPLPFPRIQISFNSNRPKSFAAPQSSFFPIPFIHFAPHFQNPPAHFVHPSFKDNYSQAQSFNSIH